MSKKETQANKKKRNTATQQEEEFVAEDLQHINEDDSDNGSSSSEKDVSSEQAAQESTQETEAETGGVEDIQSLKEELQQQKDKYIRLMAEFENFKRRTAKEYEKRIKTANEKLMSDIIEIREDLDRALNSEEKDQKSESFYDGIKMIYKRFNQQLEAHGLKTFGEVGDKFDPAVHDAMMKQNSLEIEEDHILQVFNKGYMLNDVIIRHAKVIVSAGVAE
jgi:molecular chaperone GrpE